MFCPDCGFESTQGTNYCKRCGASLSSAATVQSSTPRDNKLINAIWAVAAAIMVVGAGGMGITFGIAGGLAGSGIKPDDGPLAIVISGSTAILVALCLLGWQLSRLIGAVIRDRRGLAEAPRTGPLGEADRAARRISAPPIAVSSVTEHTTRNFEKRSDLETTARS